MNSEASAATCRHEHAYSDVTPEHLYVRSCSCGIQVWGITEDDAVRLFNSRAEQARVEGLMLRQQSGERLTEAERRIVAYSVWGTAPKCHHPPTPPATPFP